MSCNTLRSCLALALTAGAARGQAVTLKYATFDPPQGRNVAQINNAREGALGQIEDAL
jgi:hypothetical protein